MSFFLSVKEVSPVKAIFRKDQGALVIPGNEDMTHMNHAFWLPVGDL